MDSSNEARHSAAHYFLEGLNEIGFDYLFCNFGTDHAPLIEAMAAFKRADRPAPATILCPHENTAVHMAAGYAIATGRGQGVMVHVDAGTANSAMALHNLCRARIPVLLMAGKAPFTTRGELLGTRDTYVHFVQEPFDQASVVRPYTKWEYNLPSGVIAKEALRRAHTVMQSDPRGPVYLTFPRETLTELWSEGQIRSYPAERFGPVAAGSADADSLDAIAMKLLAAERPLLISSYAGRNHATVPLIDELARFAGIRVVEFNPLYVNLPHDSPCHGGFMPAKALAEADVGLLVDVDVPWIPSDMPDNPATWWAHIDGDAEKRNFPMWPFPGNLRLPGDSHLILADLLAVLKAKADSGFKARGARLRRPDQPALSLRGARQGAETVRHRAERGDPQRARGGAADAAHRARHPGRPGRRRAGLLGRHGARPEACHAGAHGRADRGRRHLLLLQPTVDPGGVGPLQAAGPHRRARQFRLGRGEGGDAPGLSRRRGQGRRRIRRHTGARHEFRHGRPSCRCARRARVGPCRRRSRHRALSRRRTL